MAALPCVAVLTASPVLAELIPDGDHDCLYLERNVEARFADMPLARELDRTAWAYTANYAERFLMPEANIEALLGAVHSRYVVRQDVNLICEVDAECWPMNHCQFELYVPRAAGVTEGREPDSYQDPMWGDRIARFLSPQDPADVHHMNERRRHMRYDEMVYEIRENGQWRRLGSMQLIGYRKSISDELDALVLEGDCAWYRDETAQAGRIVLAERRGEQLWRHAIDLPGRYLRRVARESALRQWPSVDAYAWWWADTWWPKEGYRIGYDERFSEAGAKSRGERFWIQDNHIWDYTGEFAERFGMPKRPAFLTAEDGGLEGAFAMAGLPACGVRNNRPITGPYTVNHGFRDKYLREVPKYKKWYCFGSHDYVYEFYLPYAELEAMGIEEMGLAEQMTWMPRDVLRGWRRGEKPVELCRHPTFDEWFIGFRFFRGGWLKRLKDWWSDIAPAGAIGTAGVLGIDKGLLPGIYGLVVDKWMINLHEGIEKYYAISLQELSEIDRRSGSREDMLNSWWNVKHRITKELESIGFSWSMHEIRDRKYYHVFHVSNEFRDKYLSARRRWEDVLSRVEAIARHARAR